MISRLIDRFRRPAGRDTPARAYLSRPRIDGAIELSGLSFKYPGEEAAAVDNVSLMIAPWDHVDTAPLHTRALIAEPAQAALASTAVKVQPMGRSLWLTTSKLRRNGS